MDLVDGTGVDPDTALDFPIVYASARAGRASLNRPENGALPDSENLQPLFRTMLETVPPPSYDEKMPLQAHVTNLDASPFLGRIALCRVRSGTIRKGQQVAWCKRDGTTSRVKVTELLMTERARARARGGGRPGRHHRDRRHPRDHDRRDPRRPRGPAPAAAHHRRRARDLDDDRREHLADGRPRQGPQGHRAPGQGPPRPRARRQRLGARAAHRAPGHLGGAGPRRAGARDPRRDDAARGVRADRRQAAGRHPAGERQAARAVRAPHDRRAGGVPRRDHAAARRPQGPHGADDEPRHRLGPHGVRRAVARPDRVPHRVPHRHPRHRHRAPRVRGLRAVGRRAAHPSHRLAGRRPRRRRRRRSPSRTCRSAARCSSSRRPRCTRA